MDRSAHRPNCLPFVILLTLICLVCVFLVFRAVMPRKLVAFAQARSNPAQAQWQGGDWYWLEPARETEGARLIRATSSGAQPLATAEKISVFALAEGKIAWTAQENKQWTISIAGADGSGKRSLWSGEQEPRGLALADGKVYWLETSPPAAANSGMFPPLDASLRLLAVTADGGTPEVVATLMEPEGEQVLGIHAGQLYVSAFRPGNVGATALYRIDLAAKTTERVAGEAGRQRALLTRDGFLYWSATGHEDNRFGQALCIRRLSVKEKTEKIETLNDWLPPGGHLYETERGVFYVDGSYLADTWQIAAQEGLSRPLPKPREHLTLAVGGREILLKTASSPLTNFPVYRVPLP